MQSTNAVDDSTPEENIQASSAGANKQLQPKTITTLSPLRVRKWWVRLEIGEITIKVLYDPGATRTLIENIA